MAKTETTITPIIFFKFCWIILFSFINMCFLCIFPYNYPYNSKSNACKTCLLFLWNISLFVCVSLNTRACLKNAFCKMCVTICGRFFLNEGGVVGYVNWMKAKYTANWGVQIAGMIFQTRSNFIQNSQQWYVYIHFSSISLIL